MLFLTIGVSSNLVKVFHFTIGPTMNFILQPWQLLFMILAGWVNREQQETIEYLRTDFHWGRFARGARRDWLGGKGKSRQSR